jgi:2,4-dienoyl-CoA reductase-like NADH-dependent reductase (Old Yellow Enzyme family)
MDDVQPTGTTGCHMNENVTGDRRNALSNPLTLRGGITLPNRLAKAATSEHLADRRGAPTNQLVTAYRALARSGTGLLISGNVMVDGAALEAPRNVVIEDGRHHEQLRRWAAVTEGTDAKFILQLSHPGRQTLRGNVLPGRRQDVVGPSEVALAVGGSRLFRAPRALSDSEITAIIGRFASAARVAADAGFHGVEIHAAHGYLFNQFLSPLVNQRTDRWGGSLENRMRLLVETVREIRAATSEQFLIAVKLNSADFQRGGFAEADAQRVIAMLEPIGVDFVELSGGSYESPAMSGRPADARSLAREAYFLDLATELAATSPVPLMLTGGISQRDTAEKVLANGVSMVGMATALAVTPDLPNRWRAGDDVHRRLRPVTWTDKTLASAAGMALVRHQLRRIARGKDPVLGTQPWLAFMCDNLDQHRALRRYRAWLQATT